MASIANISSIDYQDAGYNGQTIALLNEHFIKLIEQNKIHCASYLLSKDGKVLAEGAFGPLRYDSERLYDLHSIRRIASITKLFTAVAIFQLIEQGKIHLKQGVSEWIEEFKHPMFEKINIMHLLTHTSGINADPFYFLEPYPAGWNNLLFAFQPETDGTENFEEHEKIEQQRKSAWIRAVLAGKPLSKPGEQWNYSTAAYNILGEIVTRVSGIPYEQYVIDHIAKPLGLTKTFFTVPEELHSEVCIINEDDQKRLDYKPGPYDSPRAGGGLYSSLYDLFQFGQMLLNNGTLDGVQILSRKSIEKMTVNILDKGIPAFS